MQFDSCVSCYIIDGSCLFPVQGFEVIPGIFLPNGIDVDASLRVYVDAINPITLCNLSDGDVRVQIS